MVLRRAIIPLCGPCAYACVYVRVRFNILHTIWSFLKAVFTHTDGMRMQQHAAYA